MLSLVISVYRNEGSIPDLLAAVEELNHGPAGAFEAIFVVDGSPDSSPELLQKMLPGAGFRSQLLSLSRSFGAFAAVRAGLAAGGGDIFAVMAADLQEPPELVLAFREALDSDEYDAAVRCRDSRADPIRGRFFSATFWGLCRMLIQREVSRSGVDGQEVKTLKCRREFPDRFGGSRACGPSTSGPPLGTRRNTVTQAPASWPRRWSTTATPGPSEPSARPCSRRRTRLRPNASCASRAHSAGPAGRRLDQRPTYNDADYGGSDSQCEGLGSQRASQVLTLDDG